LLLAGREPSSVRGESGDAGRPLAACRRGVRGGRAALTLFVIAVVAVVVVGILVFVWTTK
jgi:hypothetical protein